MCARPAASWAWSLLLVGQRHVRTLPYANKNGLASAATASASLFSSFSDNPYRVLNVPVNSNYDTVKTAFLKAALQHHPDHSKQANTAAFIRIRQAFEEIVSQTSATSTDTSVGTTTSPVVQTWKSDAEFQAWFRQATGEFLAFDMNHDTRQEVIRAYRTMSAGGKDKGGYWEMARQLAEREDAVQGQTAGRSSSASIKSSSISSTSRAEKPECPSSNLRRKRNR
jgi:DnaJ-class molecular chaperone